MKGKKTAFKLLVIIILYSFIGISAYRAGYAMIYHKTSFAISLAAVLISFSSSLYLAGDRPGGSAFRKRQRMLWMGPVIYSLNKWLILAGALFNLIPERWLSWFQSNKEEHHPEQKAGIIPALNASIPVAFAFLIADFAREYSVWHKPVLNILPVAIPFLIIILRFTLPRISK